MQPQSMIQVGAQYGEEKLSGSCLPDASISLPELPHTDSEHVFCKISPSKWHLPTRENNIIYGIYSRNCHQQP